MPKVSVYNIEGKKVIYYKKNDEDKVLGYVSTHNGKIKEYESLKFKQGNSIDVIKPISKSTFTKHIKLLEDQLLIEDFFKDKHLEIDLSK